MAKRLSINNFKFGLDGRKSELTSVPGTLVTASNGHINQGAEFEKRKAFVLQGALPTGCYGLQETTGAIYTFGSGAASIVATTASKTGSKATITFATSHGYAVGQLITCAGFNEGAYTAGDLNGTKTITDVTLLTIKYACSAGTVGTAGNTGTVTFPVSLPTGVSYQRLRHFIWDAYEGRSVSNYDGSTTSLDPNALGMIEPVMNGVVHSSSYKGNTTVIATFAASASTVSLAASRQVFYNGQCVRAMFYGYSFTNNASVNQGLAAQGLGGNILDRISDLFDITLPAPYQVYVQGGISTDFDATFASSNPTALVDSEGAELPRFSTVNSATDPVTAVSASVTFYLTAGTSGSISVCKAPDASGGTVSATQIDLIGSAQNFATSLLITAQNIANTINGRASTTGGYNASASLVNGTKVAKITITAPESYGALVNGTGTGLGLNVTSTGTIKVSSSSVAGSGAVGALSVIALAGGVTAAAAAPQISFIDFTDASGGDWIQGTYWGGVFVENDIEYTVGQGNLTGVTPTFLLPLGKKLYMACGTQYNFSAIDDPQGWESQDTGAGFVQVNDFYSSPSNIVSMGWYQGKMGVFGRRNIQIWNVNADPAQYTLAQSFQNIGTFAPLSVQSLGELDILFLSDTGFRSLRVRDSSLNAYVVDVGSPVDSFVQSDIISVGITTASAACSIVEPSSNRYWGYLNGKIYTLSLFPSLKIQAWSTYLPTYNATTTVSPNSGTYSNPGKVVYYGGLTLGEVCYWQKGAGAVSLTCDSDSTLNLTASGYFTVTAGMVSDPNGVKETGTTAGATVHSTFTELAPTTFTPSKFLVYNGQVYVLATNGQVFLYGGSDNNTYDTCVATIEFPWLDAKEPHKIKYPEKIGVAMEGAWQVEFGADPRGSTATKVVVPYITPEVTSPSETNDSTFDRGSFPLQSVQGTHFKVKAYTSPTYGQVATFSAFTITYNEGDEQ